MMNKSRWLVLIGLFINYSVTLAGTVSIGSGEKEILFRALALKNGHSISSENIFTGHEANDRSGAVRVKGHRNELIDSMPKTNDVVVIVPFEYKQSSLNYPYTFKVIDSAVEILLANDSVTLSIDGFSYFDEGSDFICYWLALDRALAVKYYVLGRGVDSARLIETRGLSSQRSKLRQAQKEPVEFNCTAEIILKYPIPPPPVVIGDMDEDGIMDDKDSCANEYGNIAHNGCPDKDAIIVPFEPQLSALFSVTYKVLDSVIAILKKDPSFTIQIKGHSYKTEGVESVCESLAKERADIVKRYLLTRGIDEIRIDSIQSFSSLHPINAGRNPWEKARNARAEIFLIHH